MRFETLKLPSLLKRSLLIFILFSLVLAITVFWNMKDKVEKISSLDPFSISIAIFVQAVATCLIVLEWRQLLLLYKLPRYSFKEYAGLVGINALGKYMPGKVLGSVARVLKISQSTENIHGVVVATFVEQIALLHSGFVLFIVFASLTDQPAYITLLAVGLSVISLFFAKYIERIIVITAKLCKLPLSVPEHSNDAFNIRRYAIAFMYLTIIWLVSALTLHFCIHALIPDHNISFIQTIIVTVLAYLAGFIAIVSPGGLGIREGVMIALLSPAIGLTNALSVSILHRLITMFFDILLGLFSLTQGDLQNTKQP